MHVFIDTNILLSFYHFTSDDLDELQKLIDSIKKGAITLLLPEQVSQEFWRNREAKIADALLRLREQKLNLQFPQICKDSPHYTELRNAQKEYERSHGLLITELMNAAGSGQLKADKVIDELFNVATKYPMERNLIAKAHLRINLGNPPGKNGSLGDAINWETLLEKVPDSEAIYFISDDKDFRSALDDKQFSHFLRREWTERKHSELLYYNKLSAFFADYYPHIKLATEKEIERLISELADSGSFAITHSIIAKFNQYTDFTNDQLNQIITACLSNNQVYWIIKDEDVNQFICHLIEGKEENIDNTNLKLLQDLLSEITEEGPSLSYTDDPPF